MTEQLLESMTSEWKPQEYTDEYHHSLEDLIEKKIEHATRQALLRSQESARPTS